MTDESKRRLPWGIAVAALIALNTFAIVRWTARDTRPLAWDEAVHTRNTFEYRDRLASGSFLDAMRPVYFNYPPLYNLSVIPFLDRAPDVADAGAMANVVYLAALVVIVYLIGVLLLDRWSAFTAATLIGFYPLINVIARQTMLDLALTTWVALAFYCLIRSEYLSRPGWSAAFGAALGFGMLAKWTAAAYLVGPAIPALWACLRRRTFKGPLVALVVLAAVSAPWYAQNIVPMLARVSQLKDLPPAGGIIFTGWMKLLWYPMALFDQVNLPFLVLLVLGLAFSFGKPSLRPVLLWFFVSMLLFSLIRNNNVRYMLPGLPAAALLTAAVVAGRRWAFFLVEGVAFAFFIAFNFMSVPAVYAHAGSVPLALYDPHPPSREDWKHREIIRRVAELKDPTTEFSRVVVVSNVPYLHSTTLNITARGEGVENFSFRGVSKNRWLDFADFILLKTGNLGPDFTIATVKKWSDWMAAAPAWFPKVYKEAGRWPLPDGSEAILYRADPDPVPVSKDEMMNVRLRELAAPGIVAKNVDVRAEALSPTDTAKGRLGKITLIAGSVDFKGIAVDSVTVTLVRPQINAPRYREEGELQILALQRLSVRATLSADTVLALAAKKAKWLTEPRITFNDDVISVSGKADGRLPIHLEASLHVDGDVLQPRLESIQVGPVPIPVVFVRALVERPVPLTANREWPFRIDLGRIEGKGNELQVGAR